MRRGEAGFCARLTEPCQAAEGPTPAALRDGVWGGGGTWSSRDQAHLGTCSEDELGDLQPGPRCPGEGQG